ncbi:class I SAM-dependent methyltransferase [Denitrobaculum tricleocarpae]|uniref:Class I SAM-dependent methyltransferase n=1 Tax=Denitrobaculum tricleocarpae TaxID=2591009 RepID=A0A545T7R8_9PROT|nr:class I SAM-dependent methyltransferase [Denitrobaculum tricleocarpae]TQV73242.1 class I SAM-dependent methyltransferase [Denitrobaculum tricleocarpae]
MSSLGNCFFMYRTGAPVASICKYMLGKFRKIRLSKFRDLRKDYRSRYANGNFSSDWFSVNIPNWLLTFEDKKFHEKQSIKALEVGSFEGASSVFLVSEFKNMHLTCVDTWQGGEENIGHDGLELIEQKFDENLSEYASRIEKFKGTSFAFFESIDGKPQYDFIYIDGSHHVDDVVVDAVRAFKLLKVGGIMIFDDYLWHFYSHASDNPCAAINAFMRLKRNDLDIIYIGRQVHIQKVRDRNSDALDAGS